MTNSKESAEIIALDTLTGKDIGDTEKKEEQEKEFDKELGEQLKGKNKDSFYLVDDQEHQDSEDSSDTPEKENSSDESKKEGTKEPNTDSEGNSKTSDDEPVKTVDTESPPPAQKSDLVDKEEEKGQEHEVQGTFNESDFYKKALKEMWGDEIDTVVQEEDGEEKEVKLEDLDVDLETFKEIVNGKIDTEKSEASEGKISSEGVSDFTRQLIEIEKNGGQVKDLLQMRDSYTDTLDNIDLSNVEGQKHALWLRYKAAGYQDEDITRIVNSLEQEGTLEENSEQADKELRDAVKQQVEQRVKDSENKKEELKQKMKNYKKDLKGSLSDQFQLNDNVSDKIVKTATKKDEDGSYYLDKVYSELRRDPKKAARLTLFMLDEDEYIGQVTSEKLKEEKLNRSSKLKIKAPSKGQVTSKQKKKSNEKGLISLEDL